VVILVPTQILSRFKHP